MHLAVMKLALYKWITDTGQRLSPEHNLKRNIGNFNPIHLLPS